MGFVRVDFDEPLEYFHRRRFEGAGREVWVPALGPTPTLVLGSSQPDSDVDRRRAAEMGVDIVRRRSGGGAVLVSAHDVVWFDVIVERDDPLWSDDVGRAFEWLGSAIAAGLETLGHHAEMHRGRHVASPWSKRVCFAGLGPGELTIDGAKVVGISQRRTRDAARFQVAILRRWEPETYATLLGLDHATAELAPVAVGITNPPTTILDAILGTVPLLG